MTTPNPTQSAPVADLQSFEMDEMMAQSDKSTDFNADMFSFGQARNEILLPTPPTSQKIGVEHDPAQYLEQGSPLFSSPGQEIDGPLLAAIPETDDFTSLPEAFQKPFNFARFGMLVEDVVTNKYGLRKYLENDIQVTVCDPLLKVTPSRTTTFRKLWFLAQDYCKLEIPTVEPKTGGETYNTFPSCLKTPWQEALRLAYEDKLRAVPSGTAETYAQVMQNYELIHPKRPAKKSPKGRKSPSRKSSPRRHSPGRGSPSRRPSVDVTEARKSGRMLRHTIPKAASDVISSDATPSVVRKLILKVSPQESPQVTPEPDQAKAPVTPEQPIASSVTPKSASNKRKRSPKENSPPSTNGKRQKSDPNSTNCTATERLGRAIKLTFNERTHITKAFAEFEDALSILPNDPDREQDERAWAKSEKMDWDVYLCQKYRMFLGIAIVTEQNARREQEMRRNPKLNPKNPHILFKLNKTLAQGFGSIDVNKMSTLLVKYKEWNWCDDMVFKDKKGWRMNPIYLEKYPAKLRKSLIKKVIEWEDRVIEDDKNKIVARELPLDVETN